MKKALLFLATIVAAASCTNNDVDTTPTVDGDANQTISINVSASAPDTRVNFDDATDGSGDWIVTWAEDDALSGFSTEQTITYSMKFVIATDGYDPEASTFTGNLPYYSTAMRLVYPYNYNYYMDKETELVSLSLAAQSIASDYSNLSATTYMVSNEFDITSVDETTSHTEGGVYMTHVGAALELKMKFESDDKDEADYTITQIVVGSDAAPLPIEGKLSIADATFTTTSEGAITLSSEGIAAVEGIYTARCNIFPTTAISGQDIPVEVTMHDADNNYYTATGSVTAGGELERAKVTTIYVKLGELVGADVPQPIFTITSESGTLDSYTSSSNTYTGAMEIDEAAFYMNNVYQYTSSGSSYVAMPKSAGTIYNLTAFEGLSKIVISHSGVNYGTLYAGDATNPTSEVVATSTSGSVCTYEIPAGSSYFAFANNIENFTNIISIALHYDNLGETTAMITALDTESLYFESDDTAAQTVSIEGVGLANGTVTATLDDDTYFTVSEVADDYTFTVTPNGTNDTDTSYTATVTVSLDGVEAASALVMQAGDVALSTWSLVTTDFTTGGYSANNGSHMKDGVSYYSNQVYQNSSAMQWQTSDGYIYNEVAIPGLAQIALEFDSDNKGALQLYVGTEENPSTTTVAGTDGLYIIPEGYTFFKLKATSAGTVQTTNVTVSYSGQLAPYIAASTESLSFAGAGETLTATLALYNYIDEEVTVSSSNSHFTASIEGETLSVTAPENSSDDTLTGTLTISVEGGNSVEIEVSQASNNLATGAGYTIDWTSDGLGIDSSLLGENTYSEFVYSTTAYGDYTFAFGQTTAKYYENGNAVRVYQNETITISSDKLITSIVFTFPSTSYGTKLSTTVGTWVKDGATGTWSGSATSVTFAVSAADRISGISINGGSN